ncbi:MAG: tetratricopeptide repeat protein [Planctomycetes bacterium]|nr:tetratricopeptide repeat protein [Planctomycetota bacterium]MCB9871453.1 tetratricopeptide repeat protein [Planctomycetota bacterium]
MMFRITIAAFASLGMLAAQEPAKPAVALAFKPFDQSVFVAHVKGLGATTEQLDRFAKGVEEESAKHAVDDLLRARFSDYRDACALADKEEPRAALELTKVLENNRDPYVQAYARYQLARVFLNADDPEQAATIMADFVEKDLNRTPLDSEVIYFYGNALAKVPEREKAIRFFAAFLREFPNAPERLRSSAAQIKAELERQEGVLHDISDIMKFCERKIRKTDTGKKTQDKQKMVIDELQKIIEMLEKQENKSGGPPGGAGGINPASESKLPPGEATKGVLKKAPPKVAEKWGDLNKGDRKAIEAEINDKMSPKYKKMLKGFYKRLGKSGK